MIKEAMQYLIEQAKTEIFKFDEIDYTSRAIIPALPPQVKEAIRLNTLTSLVDYIKTSGDPIHKYPLIHITNPREVILFSRLDPKFRNREKYAAAYYDCPSYSHNQFYPSDEFTIFLQTAFIPTDQLKDLLKVVGNVREETIKNVNDDGITQTVTARSGVVRVADIEIPNPIKLVPYWTFPEVEQPEVDFIIRAKNGPTWALFEADGGAWKNRTILRIKEWLSDRVKDIPILA